MSKNWPGEIEEKLILTDDPHHKSRIQALTGLKKNSMQKQKTGKGS